MLLVSDATMCVDAGGISQTLYNVFSYLNPASILCISDYRVYKKNPPTQPFENVYLTYKFNTIHLPANRFSKYSRGFIEWLNFSINNKLRSFSKLRKAIKAFNADVVISCSFSPVGILMHHKLLQGISYKNIVPYFMDDWMEGMDIAWAGGGLQNDIKRLLTKNRSWFTISKNLSEILISRYGASPDRILEVHNPVSLSDLPCVAPQTEKEKYIIAYAGALWDMHYDAFKVVAQSIFHLKEKRKVELVLYTPKEFWNLRKNEVESLGVIYGGNIVYSQIHQKLSEADGLLLVSAFSKKWYNHSKSSLQTKITDYLKAQRLIISCGPSYSVNHDFLKENTCGICIETNKVNEVAEEIDVVLNNIMANQEYVQNGKQCLKNFSKEIVQQKVKNFLEQLSIQPGIDI